MDKLIPKIFFIILMLMSFQLSIAVNVDADLEVVEKINVAKKKITKIENQKRDIMSKVFYLDQEIKHLESKRGRLERKVYSTESQSKKVAQEIIEQREKIEVKKRQLRKRLRLMYKYGKGSGFTVLNDVLKSGNIEQYLKYLKLYSKNNIQDIVHYDQLLKELETKNTKLKTKVRKLVKEKKSLQTSEVRLEKSQKSKVAFLSKMRMQIGSSKGELTSLRGKLPEELLSISFYEKKGKLIWPVKGTIVEKYGLSTNKEFKIRLWKKSVTFQSLKKEKVYSVFKGKVAFSGELPGYGGVVIVDHNNHYYSIYSNLSKIFSTTNTNVNENEVIGVVGGIGEAAIDYGLSFGVRHYSESEDPLKWITKQFIARRD